MILFNQGDCLARAVSLDGRSRSRRERYRIETVGTSYLGRRVAGSLGLRVTGEQTTILKLMQQPQHVASVTVVSHGWLALNVVELLVMFIPLAIAAIERTGRTIRESGFTGVALAILVIVTPALDEFCNGGGSFLGVGTNHLELKEDAALGTERHQVQNALCISDSVVPENTNVGLEPLRDLY